MTAVDDVIEDLVAANRILAAQGVVDGFGHVSARHPRDPQRYLLSRARPPECIEAADIMEFTLDGDAIDARGPTTNASSTAPFTKRGRRSTPSCTATARR